MVSGEVWEYRFFGRTYKKRVVWCQRKWKRSLMYTRGLYGVREGNMALKDNNNSMSLVLE